MNMDIRVQCRTNCLCLAELYERNSSFVIARCKAVVANFRGVSREPRVMLYAMKIEEMSVLELVLKKAWENDEMQG